MSFSSGPLPFATLTLALCACFAPAAELDQTSNHGASDSTGSDSTSSTATGPGPDSTSGEVIGESSTGAASSSGAPEPECGDGTPRGEARCDPGSTGTAEPSTGTATDPFCGDGTLDPDESCDDGNTNDNDACSSMCEEQWASGNDAECSPDLATHCDYHGAGCRLNEAGDDGYCYWRGSGDETGCDAGPGIWTLSDSEFAQDHPEMHFPEGGACISHVANLRCEADTAAACEGSGADLCTQSVEASGATNSGPDVCYWEVDEAGCGDTPGIWTSPGDDFATDNPNALPAGTPACVLQVTNL